MPSEIVAAPVPDRRARKHGDRRDHLLDLAADLVEAHGVAGVTMAALADAADYAPASLYTYFASRSALLAALQQRALHALAQVGEGARASWDDALAGHPDPVEAALARLWAFSELVLAAPHDHPREFHLQQELLVTPGAEDTADAASVVPAAMAVLDLPRRLLAAAVEAGALAPHHIVNDPIDEPIDPSLVRTITWVVALNGALMADGLTTGLPATGTDLGRELTRSLLTGWGADPATLAGAIAVAASFGRPA